MMVCYVVDGLLLIVNFIWLWFFLVLLLFLEGLNFWICVSLIVVGLLDVCEVLLLEWCILIVIRYIIMIMVVIVMRIGG